MELIDFTLSDEEKFQAYSGIHGKKKPLYYNNNLYMVKFFKNSHINETISEYISSHIFKSLGFDTPETLLGYYHNKIAVALKDFEFPHNKLIPFSHIKNKMIQINSSALGLPSYHSFNNTDLLEILDVITQQKVIDSDKLLSFFWELFIVDTFICNTNRNNDNWGFLINLITKARKIAPIYGNGSSLYSKLTDDTLLSYLNHPESFKNLMIAHSNSRITIQENQINPYYFLHMSTNKNLLLALDSIINRIDLAKICTIVSDIPIISNNRKNFYYATFEYRSTILKKLYKKKKQMILSIKDKAYQQTSFV